MKKVFSSHSQCVHVWAQNTQNEGRASNVSFKDGVVYSYGYWPMAAFVKNDKGEEVVLIRDEGYSPSTSQHQSYVRQSIPPNVRTIRMYGRLSDNADNWRPTESMRAAVMEMMQHALDKAKRARKWSANHINAARRYAEAFNKLLAFFGNTEVPAITWDENTDDMLKALVAQAAAQEVKNAEEAAKRSEMFKQQNAVRAAEERIALVRWEAGEDVRTNFWYTPCVLRLKPSDPSTIQTSHGAEVPASYARRLWALVSSCRKHGMGYKPTKFEVGAFTLNEVEKNGDLHIGCHHIPYEATHRLAVKLGFITEVEFNNDVEVQQ